MKLNFETKRRW